MVRGGRRGAAVRGEGRDATLRGGRRGAAVWGGRRGAAVPAVAVDAEGLTYQFAFYSIRCSYRYSPIGVKYGTLRIYELHDYVITRSLRFYAFTSVRALVLPVRGADVCWPALARPSEAGHSRPPIPSVRAFANPAGFARVPATGSRSYTSLHPVVCPIPSPAAALANPVGFPRYRRPVADPIHRCIRWCVRFQVLCRSLSNS